MSTNPISEELLAEIQAAIEVNSIGGTDTNPVVTADGLVGDMLNIIERFRDRRAADSRANQTVVTEEEALATFTDYFVRNYPGPDTIIYDPRWHAPKIFLAAKHALRPTLSRAEGQEPVAVKPLEWITVDRAQALQASCVSGGYTIQPTKRGMCYVADWGGRLVKGNCSAEEAKAAAQADYDNRIRSALVKAPAPAVPDGWSQHQHRVAAWMLECFGPKIAMDKIERADRFIEEALELAQATGWTPDRGHALVDYVFGRPVGEIGQEVGGVMVTLAAICNTLDVNIHAEAEREVDRITQPDIVLKIRAKQAAKPTGSALPVAPPSQPLARGEGE